MENEENNQVTPPAAESKELSGQVSRGLYYCWLCGEETFGEPICPSCGIPQ
jgi:hypothetical protein